MKEQIKAMQKMGMTEEEIADIIETDKRIDKGEKLFELPKELEKGAKKARSAGNCAGYTKMAKEKKADVDKRKLLGDLLDGIPYTENVEIINPEREITFKYKGRKFKIVLSCPRS